MVHKSSPAHGVDVSIIIPVCGRQENIRRCLDSVIHQTLQSLEVIIILDVQDGETISICNDFCQKDIRLKTLKSGNKNVAALCNEAISDANGRYIGFVFSSDWVEPEMYETLCKQAAKHGTDVIYSFPYTHKDNKKQIDMHWVDGPHLLNAVIKDKWRGANIFIKGPGIRGCILNKDFLNKNNIRFNAELDNLQASVINFSFFIFYLMSSFFVYRGAYCHFEIEDEKPDEAASKKAMKLIDGHVRLLNTINGNAENMAIQAEIAKACIDLENLYRNSCAGYMQKKLFLNSAIQSLGAYLHHLKDNRYLNHSQKKLFKRIVRHPYVFAFFDKQNLHIKAIRFFVDIKLKPNVSYLRILRFPIIFIKANESYSTFNICKIPLRRTKITVYDKNIKKTKYYYFWMPLLKKLETNEEIKRYFLGIRITQKPNIQAQLSYLTQQISQLPSHTDIVYYSGMMNIVTQVHSRVFPQFKHSNVGKTIAILGTGPSFSFAPEILNSKIIACNRSFMLIGDKEPDYIFAHDYINAQDYFDEILKKSCPIFLGHFIVGGHNDHKVAPEIIRTQENIYNYYSGFLFHKSIRTEIEYFPLATFTSIIDPALHFALYSSPEIIYLIGCDASLDGYANKNQVQYELASTEKIRNGHLLLRRFRDTHYPSTRIISVNPLGLRGVYEDVYTEEFLKQQEIEIKNPVIVDKI